MSKVQRIYFAPLDQLGLVDTTKRPHEDLYRISFGNCEIVVLEDEHLVRRIPVLALRRFETRYWFESERLARFYYLVTRVKETAGPIWQRGCWANLHQFLGKRLEEIGQITLYESVYPEPIEDALFTILLSFRKDPSVAPEKPFAIPWLYSFTNDPFSEPQRAPDPSPLSWRMVGDPDDEQELPDRSNSFSFGKAEIEDSLGERWERLQAVLNRSNDDGANLHPLTKHFFVKAFQEEGVDEIIALVSCVEATLMPPDERHTDKLLKRYKRPVNNEIAYNRLKLAYCVRNKYLHSLGDRTDTTSWEELAKYRWAVAEAVDNYLALTEEKSGKDRGKLLRSLKR
jgi:hypothetical protein